MTRQATRTAGRFSRDGLDMAGWLWSRVERGDAAVVARLVEVARGSAVDPGLTAEDAAVVAEVAAEVNAEWEWYELEYQGWDVDPTPADFARWYAV